MALKALTPELFGEVSGPQPTVLALHGWGRDRSDFADNLEGFEYISVDLPGFGASPVPPGPWTTRQYAEALIPVVESFGEPPVLVGHSFGGRVAVHLAGMTKVEGLLLIGTPLFRPPTQGGKVALGYRVVRWAARRRLVSGERLEAAKQKYGSADYRAAEGVMREVLVQAINESYGPQLEALDVPVYLLWGEDDTAAPAWNVGKAEALLSEPSDKTVVAGVGHDVHLLRPELVAEAVRCLS
jgi:pimeloyl-ACP methyl ester carboxylesterase